MNHALFIDSIGLRGDSKIPVENTQELQFENVHLINSESTDTSIVSIGVNLVLEVLDGQNKAGEDKSMAVHISGQESLARLLDSVQIDKHRNKDSGGAVDILNESAHVKIELKGLLESRIKGLKLRDINIVIGAIIVRIDEILDFIGEYLDKKVIGPLCGGGVACGEAVSNVCLQMVISGEVESGMFGGGEDLGQRGRVFGGAVGELWGEDGGVEIRMGVVVRVGRARVVCELRDY